MTRKAFCGIVKIRLNSGVEEESPPSGATSSFLACFRRNSDSPDGRKRESRNHNKLIDFPVKAYTGNFLLQSIRKKRGTTVLSVASGYGQSKS